MQSLISFLTLTLYIKRKGLPFFLGLNLGTEGTSRGVSGPDPIGPSAGSLLVPPASELQKCRWYGLTTGTGPATVGARPQHQEDSAWRCPPVSLTTAGSEFFWGGSGGGFHCPHLCVELCGPRGGPNGRSWGSPGLGKQQSCCRRCSHSTFQGPGRMYEESVGYLEAYSSLWKGF